MAKFGMDLSKFKKISSSDKKTTLKHEDGHFLVISHKHVGPGIKKALDSLKMAEKSNPTLKQSKMADGGEVAEPDPKKAEEMQSGATQSGWQPKQWVANVKSGLGLDKGGKVPAPNTDLHATDPVETIYNPPIKQEPGHSIQKMASGGLAEEVKDIDLANTPQPEQSTANEIGPLAWGEVDPASPEAQAPTAEAPIEQQQAAPTPAPEQNIEMPPATSIAEAAPPAPSEEGNAPPSPEQAPKVGQHLYDERQKWAEDLANQHVTPQTYRDLFAKKDTLGKIGTIFGLLLSGAGSGLSHQPNALLKMMDNEITNDLEAQKSSKTNAQNYLKLHQQQELNKATIDQMVKQGKLTEAQAKNMEAEANIKAFTGAKMKMDVAAFHDLAEKTKALPPGPVKQQAEQTLALMGQQLDISHANMADLAESKTALANSFGVQSGDNTDESKFQADNRFLRLSGNEKLANDKETRHFPGIPGQSSAPLSPADKEKLDSGIIFDQKLKRFMDWTAKHSGDVNPAHRKAGEAMAAELQGAYRQATHGGVYKEGEQNFISRLIDSTPTKFFNTIRVMPQLKALYGEHQSRMNQTARSLGFPGYRTPTETNQAPQSSGPEEGSTSTSKGRPIIFKGGKWQYT